MVIKENTPLGIGEGSPILRPLSQSLSHSLTESPPAHSWKWYLYLVILLIGSIVVLSQGIGQITGLTEQDEYHHIFRTALTMMERDEWLVPYLDGLPRLRKPPMITWLTRLSFELFGISLTSARIISVSFASILVLSIALIGFKLTADVSFALFASLIALSTAGLAVQSRFLLHDIPAAALSALALVAFLQWCASRRPLSLGVGAVLLAASLLTKGPFALAVFASGVAALVIADGGVRSLVGREWKTLLAALLLFLTLSLPWFLYVYLTYPNYVMITVDREMSARQLGTLTFQPILTILSISTPWQFLLIASLCGSRMWSLTGKPVAPSSTPAGRNPEQEPPAKAGARVEGLMSQEERFPLRRILILWLGLSLLPFFFFKFAERYIVGSLVPLSLLCALGARAQPFRLRVCARAGFLVASIGVLSFVGLSWWFKTSTSLPVLVLLSYGCFAFFWWQGTQILPMAASAAILWMMICGFLYPSFGTNEFPLPMAKKLERENVILFGAVKPPLLPILVRRSLEFIHRPYRQDITAQLHGNSWILVAEPYTTYFEESLRASGARFEQIDSYRTLPSIEHLLKASAKETGRNLWVRAFQSRSLEPVKETIRLYRLE